MSCIAWPYVKNSDGKVVKSKLFEDLRKLTGERKSAVEYYSVATDENFLEAVGEQASFDENGEITLHSLQQIINIAEGDNVIASLEREIKTEAQPFAEAIRTVTDFNRKNSFRGKYMATIVPAGNQFKVQIVKRTANNLATLNKIIRNQTLQDKLIYTLQKYGINTEFLENSGYNQSRYSTEHAETTADGLVTLVKLIDGENVEEVLAEEAGHAAIGMLGDKHPLVRRLEAVLTPEVMKELLGDEYSRYSLGPNPAREVAGRLVGEALANRSDEKSAARRLANKIADAVKHLFYKITPTDRHKMKMAIMDARDLAEAIAYGFTSDEFEGSVEKALSKKETLFHTEGLSKSGRQAYAETVEHLSILGKELENVGETEINALVKTIATQMVAGRTKLILDSPGIWGDLMALEGLGQGIYLLASNMGESSLFANFINEIKMTADNEEDFFGNIVKYGKQLHQIQLVLGRCKQILDMLDAMRNSDYIRGTLPKNGTISFMVGSTRHEFSFNDLYTTLSKAAGTLNTVYKNAEAVYLTKFLSSVYGSDNIHRSARIVWQYDKDTGKKRFTRLAEADEKISDHIANLEPGSMEGVRSLISSMSNSEDIIGAIMDKAVRGLRQIADRKINEDWNTIREMKAKYHQLRKDRPDLPADPDMWFERDYQGRKTGNMISDRNWGEWEADRQAFIDDAKKRFNEKYPNIKQLTHLEKGILWDEFFHDEYRAWNDAHSFYNDKTERWEPLSSKYPNPDYQKLVSDREQFEIFQQYKAAKERIDKTCLPDRCTLSVRMPQFRGNLVDRISQAEGGRNKWKSIGRWLHTKFCEDSLDSDYGNLNTFNSEEDQLIEDPTELERDCINRLPMYGINKITRMEEYEEDEADEEGNIHTVKKQRKVLAMDELSPDPFQALLLYSSMAHNYKAMSSVVDAAELLSNKLNDRILDRYNKGGKKYVKAKESDVHTKYYDRYTTFLAKSVYGKNSRKVKVGNVELSKVAGVINRLSALRFLAGNVHGGIVNTMTGVREIFKEAIAGEYFGIEDIMAANGIYFGDFFTEIELNCKDYITGGREATGLENNKVALFVKYFDARSANEEKRRDWATQQNRFFNAISKTLFFPYQSGDNYMQTIPYLAIANKIILYTEDGKPVKLYDAYVSKELENGAGRKLELNGTFFKFDPSTDEGQRALQEYKDTLLLLSYAKTLKENKNLAVDDPDYFKEITDFLIANKFTNLETDNLSNIIEVLDRRKKKYIWSDIDENNFQNQAREVTNRLHGIYNMQDKSALSQVWFGQLLLSMKNWMTGMLERRYGNDHFSVSLGRDTEGTMVTLLKVLRSIGSTIDGVEKDKVEYLETRGSNWNAFLHMLQMVVAPVIAGKSTKTLMSKLGFSEHQFRNMRRLNADMATILNLVIASLLCKWLPPNDDEYIPNLAYYFLMRGLYEQEALTTFTGGWREWTGLFVPASGSMLMESAETLTLLALTIAGSDKARYKQEKEDKFEEGDLKLWSHMKKMIPYYKSWYVFRNPKQAWTDYEYGINMKRR